MPVRKLYFCFGAVKIGSGKSDGEADAGVEELVVVEEIVYATVEDVKAELDGVEETLRGAEFEIVAMRRLYREAEKIGIERSKQG